MRIPSAYFAVLGGSLLVALIPVVWPSLDLSLTAFFMQAHPPIQPTQWLWVEWINEYTPDVFRTTAILFILFNFVFLIYMQSLMVGFFYRQLFFLVY